MSSVEDSEQQAHPDLSRCVPPVPLSQGAGAQGRPGAEGALLAAILALLYVAAWFYSRHLPERWRPGAYDYVGNSHQIMHSLVLAPLACHARPPHAPGSDPPASPPNLARPHEACTQAGHGPMSAAGVMGSTMTQTKTVTTKVLTSD